MSKYLKRLAARHCLANLKESKSWIVTRKLICETDEGEMEFNAGETIDVGGDDEGNLALQGQSAVVVITDDEVASKVAEVLKNAEELGDVQFVEKDALNALGDGEDVEDVVDALGDAEGDEIEVAEVDVDPAKEESCESKYAKFAENTIRSVNMLKCESVLIADEAAPLNMSCIKSDRTKTESYNDYKAFAKRIADLEGSIQPGAREIALNKAGKVFGVFDESAGTGTLFVEEEFDNAEAMDAYDMSPVDAMEDVDLGAEADEMAVESCLKAYEESAQSGKDYLALTEALEKAGVKEEKIGTIVSTFGNSSLQECVKVYDSKYGKHVKVFTESVNANNFIVEAGENRFTKRYFG